MKKYLLVLFSFSVSTIFAQPVFNSCNQMPVYGDSMIATIQNYDTAAFSPGNAGANVSWNFTLNLSSAQPVNHYYYNPLLTQGDSLYAGTNLADSTDYDNLVSYYTYSADSISSYGDYLTPSFYHAYWNPKKKFICPFAFGNNFSENYSWHSSPTCPQHHSYMNRTVTYDGYGTLTINSVTTSVLRIKYADTGLDSVVCFPPYSVSSVTDTTYLWYDAATFYPVLMWDCYRNLDNGLVQKTLQGFSYSHLPQLEAGIAENKMNDAVLVYPNPSNGKFQITNYKSQLMSIEVYSSMGEKVFETKTSSASEEITLKEPGGIYLLKINSAQSSASRKIVVQK